MGSEYDRLAAIYDAWSAADPAAEQTLHFYVDTCVTQPGTVVELGVGNGRIALELMKRGIPVIGVDDSAAMLAACEERARALGIAHLIQLIHADMRTFTLPVPASLIILPFRTLGHLIRAEDKLAGLRRAYAQLEPGGRLIFDHYVVNLAWARSHHGIPKLMCIYPAQGNGGSGRVYIWDTYLYDFAARHMDCTITIEETDHEGVVVRRQHAPLAFTWVEPEEVRSMIMEAGFEVEAVYGDFDKRPLTPNSREQIWICRRPIGAQ